ncbi:gliding motility-associated-like protein [Filimonas zeae]|uniref:PKD domain-containing protein n=1 Tax=Filimonas zeae TaxID=1737353 RepID=A0A917IZR5_9BACT|nr:gliding motility-associated C-terminal domain-containing protein [Filimonas zeae]MDR6340083.1 gliding motility-associated-like protein [Filimonas zeae]GGH71053.1 hypothetical protein GCM10011379_29990 [Filimonas zeae]
MRSGRMTGFTVLLLLLAGRLAAQGLSNRGKEFWTGYGLHQFMEYPYGDNSQQMVLYFSAEQAAEVTVTVRGRTDGFSKTYLVPANTVIVSDTMPKDRGRYDCRLFDYPPSFGGNGGDGLFHVSVHIKSNVPIVAYAHIYGSVSSAATMLMPVETWGYSYISLNSRQTFEDDCFSFCYVVAQHDDTKVAITPTVPTRDGKLPGVTYYATLNRGDIYQVVGAGMGMGEGYELTGTTVHSVANDDGNCYPIGFFSGSSRTRNPCSGGTLGGDNDMQQVFPYEAWGRRYFTAPTSSSVMASTFMTNIYKIIVRDAATVVKLNKQTLTNYDAASMSYTFESSKADYIEADKPILVAQFISGGCLAGGEGDPEMIYLSPIEQGIKRIGFYRNTQESIHTNYLTLIIPNKGFPSLRIDGQADFTHTYTHPQDTGYTVVVKRWVASREQCIVQSDSAFTAVTYGLGYAESYGYNAGTSINNLSALLHVHNVEGAAAQAHPFTCRNTPMEFSVLMRYQPTQLIWRLSELPGVTPYTDLTQPLPVLTETVAVNGVTYYRYKLPGIFRFDTTGVFLLPVTAYSPYIDNCSHQETIYTGFTVKETPHVRVAWPRTGCTADSLLFAADTVTTEGYSIERWKWAFEDGTIADKDSVFKQYATAGPHTVQLNVVTAEGCVADTGFAVTVYSVPKVAFTTTAHICDKQAALFTDASVIATGTIATWNWDYGDGTKAAVGNGAPASRLYAAPGKYVVKLSVTSDKGCVSRDTTQTIAVEPLPVAGFQLPAVVCMPEGKAVFTNTSTIAGDAPLTWQWNFGDGSAVSAVASPTHTYTTKGNYTVSVTATSEYGCAAGKSQLLTAFYDKPEAAFTVAPETVCAGTDNRFTDASTAPGSTVSRWSWVFGDGDVAAVRNPVKRYAAPGNYTVGLLVTSMQGCVSGVKEKVVTVYVQPVVDAGPSFTVNEGTPVTFQPVTNDSVRVTFEWSPATELNNAAVLRPLYIAREDNTFTITATAREGGCSASDFTTVKVLRPVIVPNVFSPNGDGIHDTWDITNLDRYTGCSVTVFNRYGQQVFTSAGYAVRWNGTSNGKVLPAGTYYYVIDFKNGHSKLTGSLTIIR